MWVCHCIFTVVAICLLQDLKREYRKLSTMLYIYTYLRRGFALL
jgi:hypothetical protein